MKQNLKWTKHSSFSYVDVPPRETFNSELDLPPPPNLPQRLHDRRPKSFSGCLVLGGGVDVRKLQAYTLNRAERCRRRISAILGATHPNDERSHEFLGQKHGEHNRCDGQTQEKKTRTRRTIMLRRTEDGKLQVLSPQETIWWLYYVVNSLLSEDSYYQNKFRSRFRLPYQNYLELVAECRKEIHKQFFGRWQQRPPGTRGRKPHLIELLVLGTLRYIGCGWTFDDLKEATAISRELHREFCHSFIDFGSTVLFKKHVVAPINYVEAKRHMTESMYRLHTCCH